MSGVGAAVSFLVVLARRSAERKYFFHPTHPDPKEVLCPTPCYFVPPLDHHALRQEPQPQPRGTLDTLDGKTMVLY